MRSFQDRLSSRSVIHLGSSLPRRTNCAARASKSPSRTSSSMLHKMRRSVAVYFVRVTSARIPCSNSRSGGALLDRAISSLANFMGPPNCRSL